MRSLAVLLVAGSLAFHTTSCSDDDGGDDAAGGKKATGGASTGGSETQTGGTDSGGGTGGVAAGAGGASEPVPPEGGSAGTPSEPVPPEGGSAGAPIVEVGCGLLGTSTCDPLTGAPCDLEAGETCDYIGDSFACLMGPNDGAACDACGADEDAFCGVGTNCNVAEGAMRCEKYCCDDADCESGTCNKGLFPGDGLEAVGICTDEAEDTCG